VTNGVDAYNPQDLRGLVRALRAIVADPVNRCFFRLFDEVNALAQTQPDPFPGFGRAANNLGSTPLSGSSTACDWLGHSSIGEELGQAAGSGRGAAFPSGRPGSADFGAS
jgi:hypothetical protein